MKQYLAIFETTAIQSDKYLTTSRGKGTVIDVLAVMERRNGDKTVMATVLCALHIIREGKT